MNINELIKLIGDDGAFGDDIPDDDETHEALTESVVKGWVKAEPGDLYDFFSLTPEGIKQLEFQ